MGRRQDFRVYGLFVQQSVDSGRHWASVFGPNDHPRNKAGRCYLERYQTVAQIGTSGLFPGRLILATVGRPAATTPGSACDAATGGVFFVGPNGKGGLDNSDARALGLPFSQDAAGRTPRAYSVLSTVSDPTNPNLFYADATPAQAGLSARNSPPAGLYRTLDGGRSWQPAFLGLPALLRGRGQTATTPLPHDVLTIDPAHGGFGYDVVGTRLYRTTTHGGRWRPIDAVRARTGIKVFINPYNPHLVYASSDEGLYHSLDDGASWTRLRAKGLFRPTHMTALRFDRRAPSAVDVVEVVGHHVRIVEAHAPTPHYDLSLTLTPRLHDRVVLALHGAPDASARLRVVAGAAPLTLTMTTNASGFAYAQAALGPHVSPSGLKVVVSGPAARASGAAQRTLQPWTPPGWTPGRPPAPRATPTATATTTPTAHPTLTATATATPSASATASGTPTPTVTATPSATASPTATTIPTSVPTATPVPIPTPYTAGALGQVWTWKQLTAVLPPCPALVPAVTAPAATATSAPATPIAPPPVSGSPPATAAASATPPATATPSATTIPPCSAPAPIARQDTAAAWGSPVHQLFVFGGTDARTSTFYNDLSAYSTITSSWIAISPTTAGPTPRYGAEAVWSPSLNSMVVFGGMTGAGPYARFVNDVWAYNPTSNAWTLLSPNSAAGAPQARAHAATVWDPTNNRLLIFGGQTDDLAPSTLTRDLWSFTPGSAGGVWTNLSPNVGDQNIPPARQWAQMAWDTPNNDLHLFGGKNPGNGSMSDTWTWSQSGGWTYEDVQDQPAGRQAAGYAWDATHNRFVVGPGNAMAGNNNDVWFFAPEAPTHDWEQVPVSNPAVPPARQMAPMTWDDTDNQFLMFGGRVQATVSNDLWALIPTGGAAPAAAPAAAPGTAIKGVDIGQTVASSNNTVLLTTATVKAAAAAGARYVRVSFYIGDNQTTWTAARLHAYEGVIALFAQQNIGVLAVASAGVTGGWSPANWIQNAQETTGGNGDNPAIDDYAHQISILVAHFAPAPYNVLRWEIWNEPNVPLAGCGDPNSNCTVSPSLQPSNFAFLLGASYGAVKGVSGLPPVQLISGGVFGHSISGAYNSGGAGQPYIAAVYDEGVNHAGQWTALKNQYGTYPLDAVGEHLYVDQGQRTTPTVLQTYLDWFRAGFGGLDPGKSTVLTEVGWRTNDASNQPEVTPDMQALNLDVAFKTARRSGYVSDLLWFELEDNPGYAGATTWGLIDRYGTAKHAYAHFQAQ